MSHVFASIFDPKNLPTILLVSIYSLIVVLPARVIWQRYRLLLTAPPGGRNWNKLLDLRAIAVDGGTWASWYGFYLPWLLNGLDWLFGDRNAAERSLAPRFFGLLHAKAPLWTARGYDRCLLLALASPVLFSILCWAAWNTQGAAEPALGLGSRSLPARLALLAALAAVIVLAWRSTRKRSRVDISWRYPLSPFFIVIVIAIAIAGVVAGALVAAVVGVVFYARSGPVAIPSTFAFACAAAGLCVGAGAVLGFIPFGHAAAFVAVHADFVALAGIFPVLIAQFVAMKFDREAIFSVCFAVGITCLVIALPIRLVHGAGAAWRGSGALLLFLGLLPLLNAPFDWMSIGITRGLLRLSLQIKAGPTPYLLALGDLVFSLLWLFVLAAVMVLGVRLFNLATRGGGGKLILDLHDVVDRLRNQRGDPENYWIYITLLTTLLPSGLNVTIAAASFGSRIPPLRRYVLNRIDPNDGVDEPKRKWVAAALTVPWLLGLIVTPAVFFYTFRLLYGEDGILGNAMLAWARLLAGGMATQPAA